MGAIASAWLHGQPAADAAAWAWMRTPPPPTPGCGCLDVAAGRDKLHGLQLPPPHTRDGHGGHSDMDQVRVF